MLDVSVTSRLGAFTLDAQMQAGDGTTVIFGRSGSGKTSLVNAIAGLSQPETAKITLNGVSLNNTGAGIWVPPHRRGIGYVFQDARLFPHLDVAGNLDYGARFAASPLRGADRAHLIDVLGIGALLRRRPGALSGGEKQRVALGRALMTRPNLLLLDEPLAALDTARKEEILPYLEALRREGQPPMIYVTHDMSEIVRLADRLVVMRDGVCVLQGPAQEVLSDPANIPLIGVQDAGALVEGHIIGHTEDGLTRIALSAAELMIPRVPAPEGTQVRVRLRAQDVTLTLQKPEGYSGLNVLPVTVSTLKPGQGPGVAVALRCGSDALLSRLTARAVADMKLKAGDSAFALINASAVPAAAIARSKA